MKKNIFYIMPLLAIALGACTAANKSAETAENTVLDTTALQGEWRLDSYRVDSVSTNFDAGSTYKLSFNEPDSIFSLSTDCNMINGGFVIANDTLRFENMLVTEMACDNMVVEQDMLRLLNDSTGYATAHGDTLTFISPYIGSAIFIKDKEHIGN